MLWKKTPVMHWNISYWTFASKTAISGVSWNIFGELRSLTFNTCFSNSPILILTQYRDGFLNPKIDLLVWAAFCCMNFINIIYSTCQSNNHNNSIQDRCKAVYRKLISTIYIYLTYGKISLCFVTFNMKQSLSLLIMLICSLSCLSVSTVDRCQ